MSDVLAQDLANILQRSPALWEMLRGRSLFLTGGTGLFGRWLLEALCHANRELDLDLHVTVLTRDAEAFTRQAPHLASDVMLTLHSGDVRDFEFPQGYFDYLIHGATTSASETFNGEDSLRKFDTLVDGTRRVLDFAVQCEVERFLFLSSGVAYGTQPADMSHIPESYQGAPDTSDVDTSLGQAKRAAEYLSTYYAHKHGWNNTIARCFSFAGPFMPLDLHYAIGNFIHQALHEEEIMVKGDGTSLRSYLYLGDLVTWLLTLLLQGRNGQIYNVGSDQEISIGELARLVRDIVSSGKIVNILGLKNQNVGNPIRNRYVPDINKARKELGLDGWTCLSAAIRRTAAHAAPLPPSASSAR
ncbi:MAG: NAD(P)-dependent oxidoreductase [Gammaproteobacteria bacterium]|nr:NAD(P)-dependent oxidoreductase [Sideroxydans sp.]MBU3904448.1 NAD(P)-dependent oxidoreductase [Gammaproteobacteria bacterium]MBU4046431.1 NAD(P)-dependent oxidoreductase [Gammaproteobacteria bacterium]MBU4150848.1 NAD(P)-dependent oxidoreductase [Gammaproteobacteria bacterium]